MSLPKSAETQHVGQHEQFGTVPTGMLQTRGRHTEYKYRHGEQWTITGEARGEKEGLREEGTVKELGLDRKPRQGGMEARFQVWTRTAVLRMEGGQDRKDAACRLTGSHRSLVGSEVRKKGKRKNKKKTKDSAKKRGWPMRLPGRGTGRNGKGGRGRPKAKKRGTVWSRPSLPLRVPLLASSRTKSTPCRKYAGGVRCKRLAEVEPQDRKMVGWGGP